MLWLKRFYTISHKSHNVISALMSKVPERSEVPQTEGKKQQKIEMPKCQKCSNVRSAPMSGMPQFQKCPNVESAPKSEVLQSWNVNNKIRTN